MRTNIFIPLIFTLVILVISKTTSATVSTQFSRGEVTVSWTNSASTHCATNQSSYFVREYQNGSLTKTIYISNQSQKSTTIEIPRVVQRDTGFGYTVYYFRCMGSGGAYLIAGSSGKNVEAPDIEDRRVIFIHTDVLGSPAAESNERGEKLND